ncbi:hypothetical protein F5I97DRAFT_1852035 [Phlebopus sp. FC_14]|nr:hypothetical protein F5I97DRAFT_1852035 [Phlebopus sp. FC_14]
MDMLDPSNKIRKNTAYQLDSNKNDAEPFEVLSQIKFGSRYDDNEGSHHQATACQLSPIHPQSDGHHITEQEECASPICEVSESPQNLALIASPQRNIVVFGDSGVGKSSLINMLAGHEVAKTSSSAIGCTFQSTHYKIFMDGELYNIWDTAGLDEGTQGRVPAELAEKYLTKLLRDLGGANGIHLLVYCVRGSSIKKSLTRNYAIFYSAICRKKVPIVVVVTGLENEPFDMAKWWTKGEKELTRYKMRFDDHACVTTLDINKTKGTPFEQRSIQSREAVRKLVISNCRPTSARGADVNRLIKAAVSDLRSMIKSGWESQGASNIIIMSADVSIFRPGFMGDWERCSTRIRGRPFVFFHINDPSGSRTAAAFKNTKRSPDLLIFAGRSSTKNADKFQWFYNTYRGEICPAIVVSDEPSPDGWDRQLLSLGVQANVVSVDSNNQSSKDLHTMIDELCLFRGAKIRRGSIFNLFMRRTSQPSPSDDFVNLPFPVTGRTSSFVREGSLPEKGLARRPSGNLSQHGNATC